MIYLNESRERYSKRMARLLLLKGQCKLALGLPNFDETISATFQVMIALLIYLILTFSTTLVGSVLYVSKKTSLNQTLETSKEFFYIIFLHAL